MKQTVAYPFSSRKSLSMASSVGARARSDLSPSVALKMLPSLPRAWSTYPIPSTIPHCFEVLVPSLVKERVRHKA